MLRILFLCTAGDFPSVPAPDEIPSGDNEEAHDVITPSSVADLTGSFDALLSSTPQNGTRTADRALQNWNEGAAFNMRAGSNGTNTSPNRRSVDSSAKLNGGVASREATSTENGGDDGEALQEIEVLFARSADDIATRYSGLQEDFRQQVFFMFEENAFPRATL